MSLVRTTAAALLLTVAPAPAATLIKIGITEKAEMMRNYAPLLAQLNTGPQLTVAFVPFAAVDELYGAFKDRRVTLAVLGPVNYVRAHHEFGASPILADGAKYASVIAVRADSPIKTVADLEGKRFAFGYKDSTSSHLVPMLLLSKGRVDLDDLAAHAFVGGHEKVAEEILAGRYDAGALVDEIFKRAVGLRAVATSSSFAGVPLVAHKDADPKLVAEVRRLFFAYRPAASAASHYFSHGAVAAGDADYNEIRFLCRIVLKQDYR